MIWTVPDAMAAAAALRGSERAWELLPAPPDVANAPMRQSMAAWRIACAHVCTGALLFNLAEDGDGMVLCMGRVVKAWGQELERLSGWMPGPAIFERIRNHWTMNEDAVCVEIRTLEADPAILSEVLRDYAEIITA